jgi:hypothetical protein
MAPAIRTLAAVAVGTSVLMVPASASGLTAQYEPLKGLVIEAGSAETNSIEAGFFGSPPAGFLPFEYRVLGSGAMVSAQEGCAPEAGSARCRITGIRAVSVSLSHPTSADFRWFGDADVTVASGAGADVIRTGEGGDLIDSGPGNDVLLSGGGSNVLRAGDGNDQLVGSGVLEPGKGRDRVQAGPDDDVIRARDGETDIIVCGSGKDTLDIDLKDGKSPADCEIVNQGAVREGPHVRVLTSTAVTRPSGSFTVALACPRVVTRCSGRLTVAAPALGLVTSAYSIRPGRSKNVGMQLGRSARRALTRRRSLPTRLVSVETGDHGRKTTIRPLRLVRRRAKFPPAPVASPRAALAGAKSLTVTFVIGQGLSIRAFPGVRNRVQVTSVGSPAPGFRVRDNEAEIVAGSGCTPVSQIVVECRSFGPQTVRALLGDVDDRFEFIDDHAGGADAVIDGGESFDRIEGGDGYDVLLGGVDGGFDHLDGHAGNDVFLGGPGGDFLTGGSGNDRVFGESGGDFAALDNGERLFLADGQEDCYVATRIFILEKDAIDKEGCPN